MKSYNFRSISKLVSQSETRAEDDDRFSPDVAWRNRADELVFPELGFKLGFARSEKSISILPRKDRATFSVAHTAPQWLGIVERPASYPTGSGILIASVDSFPDDLSDCSFALPFPRPEQPSTATQAALEHGACVVDILKSVCPLAKMLKINVNDLGVEFGGITPERVIAAMIFAAAEGAQVCNVSLDLSVVSQIQAFGLNRAMRFCMRKKCAVFAAAGNHFVLSSLAATRGAIAVVGIKRGHPNLGGELPSETCAAPYYVQTSIKEFSGTSAACPIAAATYALFLEIHQSASKARAAFWRRIEAALGFGRGLVRPPVVPPQPKERDLC